jgi:FIMAH domain
MNRNRTAIALGLLICLTAAVAAFDVTETTDYPGGINYSFDPSAGTLDPGSNTVSGSLNGSCLVGQFGLSCNPGTLAGGDTQDSFLITVPTGYQITSLAVTTSAVTGPAGLSASIEIDSPTAGTVLFTPFLSPLPGTTSNLLTSPIGAGLYAVSVFGQQATATGAFSLNWSVAMTLSSVSLTPAQAVTNLINLISNQNSGLGLTSGQINSLTDKLNNALASIQAGLNTQAINQLNAFISSVQSSLKTGKISAQTANTLIAAANAIIATLQ